MLLAAELPKLDWVRALEADGRIVCEAVELGSRSVLERIPPCDVILLWVEPAEERLHGLVSDIMETRPTSLLVLPARADIADPWPWLARGALQVLDHPHRSQRDAEALRGLVAGAARVSPVVHSRRPERWRAGAPAPRDAKRSPRRRPTPARARPTRPRPRGVAPPKGRLRLVAVAASTGGPRALQELVAGLPAGFGASLLVVQHMGSPFMNLLLENLRRVSQLPVELAREGDVLGPPRILLAPPGVHLVVTAERTLALQPANGAKGHVPSADVLFASVARAFGAEATGVVLSGMGDDGARGACAIREAGGAVFAQEESTCAVYGMPHAAWELGGVHQLMSPSELAERLCQRVSAS